MTNLQLHKSHNPQLAAKKLKKFTSLVTLEKARIMFYFYFIDYIKNRVSDDQVIN